MTSIAVHARDAGASRIEEPHHIGHIAALHPQRQRLILRAVSNIDGGGISPSQFTADRTGRTAKAFSKWRTLHWSSRISKTTAWSWCQVDIVFWHCSALQPRGAATGSCERRAMRFALES